MNMDSVCILADHSQAVDRNAPTPTQTQRRRQAGTPDEDGDVDMEESQGSGNGSLEHLSKSLVRYALSCEFARKPVKRQDVNEKGRNIKVCETSGAILTVAVLGSHARLFKSVFDQANSELMDVFGMTMAELPRGEKVTARQKRGMFLICACCCLSLTAFSCRRIRLAEQSEQHVGASDYRP